MAGKGESRKQRGRRLSISSECGLESLEQRVLPAADLIFTAAEVKVKTDPAEGSNQYVVDVNYTIKNIGSTGVDLSGAQLNSSSDNIKFRVYKSIDETLDGNDPLAFSTDFDLGDTVSDVLDPNETESGTTSKNFAADPNFNFLIFLVDSTLQAAEQNENNNVFVFDASKPELIGGSGIIGIPPKATSTIDSQLTVRDLNTLNFNGGGFGVSVDGAEAKDKLFLHKTVVGGQKLRIAGTKLKLGSTTIGTVTSVIPTSDNGFQMSMQINFNGEVNRDVLNKLMRNISLRPGAKSVGMRTAHFQVKDNLENFSNVKDRPIQVS